MKKIIHASILPSARLGVIAILTGVFAFVLFFASPAMAGDEKGLIEVKLSKNPEKLAQEVEDGLDYLFETLADKGGTFDPARVQPMLGFVVGMQADPKDIAPARRFGGPGICLRKEVSVDLDKILRYFYNPEIPNFLLCPAVLRLSGWHTGSEFLARKTGIWEELPNLTDPVLVRGREFEINTPDSFAEAYYSYDLNRLIVLLKFEGKNVVISISKQENKSDVGRKGAILNDQEWDYFYSGIEGLNKGLISWMDTFMYGSGSVQVFVENDAAAPRSSVFLFKWLNAGWASMNVVKRSHIYEGSLRYARSFSKILESDSLTPEYVADGLKDVIGMPENEIDSLIEEYARNFEIRFKDNPKLKKRSYAKVIADGGYAKVLDAEARKSLLILEKLKSLMGMETLIDMKTSPLAVAPAPESFAIDVNSAVEEVLPES